MIARSTQSALVALLVLGMLGLTVPQAAQAHGRESHSHGYSYRQIDRHDDDHDEGSRYAPPRGHGWRRHHDYYAPRYYPDVVIYPQEAPRVYYYPLVEPMYPHEYGSVGIHLDYNLLY